MEKPIKTEKLLVSNKINDYYYCPRCKIDSLNKEKRMCPCPRGSCEAELLGTVITEVFQTILIENKK